MNLSSQSVLIPKILNLISNRNQRILLKGPLGSGKSFVAEAISNHWESRGDNYLVFCIKGNKNKADDNCFPYIERLNEIRNKKSEIVLKRAIVELSKSIPIGGELVSYLIETLTNNKQEKKKECLKFFNETEKLVILDIDKLFHKKKFYLS